MTGVEGKSLEVVAVKPLWSGRALSPSISLTTMVSASVFNEHSDIKNKQQNKTRTHKQIGGG